MLPKIIQILLFIAVISPGSIRSQTSDAPRVDIPLEGDIVQGVVGIAGSTAVEDFMNSEVFFSFSPDGEWFPIGRQDSAVSNQLIVNWDTTLISDGTYRIRVLVHKRDGSQVETVVNNIRVQNYTNPQGGTPAAVDSQGASQERSPLQGKMTASPYPRNPAAVNSEDLIGSIRAGVFWAGGILLALGIYLGLRWFNRRR
jgi:hypothetical protein